MTLMDMEQAVHALAGLAAEGERRPGSVHLELTGPVAQVVIDNPQARHALTVGMMADLGRAVLRLQDAPHAAVVVRASTDDALCAGGHLGQVRDELAHGGRGEVMALAMGAVLDGLLALPMVSVTLVRGVAVGGGAELATATDHRVWAPDAWIQFRQARLGVAAGWGGVRRLVTHVGSRQAVRWLTTSSRITAAEALAAGLADQVDGDPVSGVQAFLAPVLALPVAGVRAVKQQVVAARAGAGARAEVDAFVAVWGGPDHRRGLGLPPEGVDQG